MLHGYWQFIIYINSKYVYQDTGNDHEERFDTSNYEVDRPLPTGNNTKVIGFTKVGLGGKIMTKFVAFILKKYSYLTDDGNSDKEAKETKNSIIKRKLKLT